MELKLGDDFYLTHSANFTNLLWIKPAFILMIVKIFKGENMNILVCYDETEASQEALKVGVQHAKAFGAKAFVITSMVGGNKDDIEDNKKAEEGLKHAKGVMEKEGIDCETHLLVRGMTSGEEGF